MEQYKKYFKFLGVLVLSCFFVSASFAATPQKSKQANKIAYAGKCHYQKKCMKKKSCRECCKKVKICNKAKNT